MVRQRARRCIGAASLLLVLTAHDAVLVTCSHVLCVQKAGSTIICTGSIQAYKPSQAILDYATSKGAIVAFVKGLAGELAEKGIRVNCVAPVRHAAHAARAWRRSSSSLLIYALCSEAHLDRTDAADWCDVSVQGPVWTPLVCASFPKEKIKEFGQRHKQHGTYTGGA